VSQSTTFREEKKLALFVLFACGLFRQKIIETEQESQSEFLNVFVLRIFRHMTL
jgi:hypothetical protein